jgi:hypothetical protein
VSIDPGTLPFWKCHTTFLRSPITTNRNDIVDPSSGICQLQCGEDDDRVKGSNKRFQLSTGISRVTTSMTGCDSGCEGLIHVVMDQAMQKCQSWNVPQDSDPRSNRLAPVLLSYRSRRTVIGRRSDRQLFLSGTSSPRSSPFATLVNHVIGCRWMTMTPTSVVTPTMRATQISTPQVCSHSPAYRHISISLSLFSSSWILPYTPNCSCLLVWQQSASLSGPSLMNSLTPHHSSQNSRCFGSCWCPPSWAEPIITVWIDPIRISHFDCSVLPCEFSLSQRVTWSFCGRPVWRDDEFQLSLKWGFCWQCNLCWIDILTE